MQHNELIQDFIFRDLPSTSNKRDFNQRMQSFLERIPNHFGQYTKNFFIGMFVGALYHFEYTEKKKKIEENYGRVRSFYHYDPNDCVLHMVFVVGEESSYLRSLVFSKEGKLSEPDVTIWTRIHRSDLVKNFSFSQKSAAKIYYKNQKGFVWEEQPIVTREKNKAFDIEAAIFSKLNEKGFIEIRPLPLTKVSPETINEYQVEIFGNNNIGIVEIAVKSYLTSSKKIYQQGLGDFNNLFGEDFVNKEAFSHGFLFGGLGLNHYLYIYSERVVGSGLVDIMLASPISPNPIPILIEDKAGTISAKEGIDQIVTTYADTTVPARGFQIDKKGQSKGIIAAVNYSLKSTVNRQLRSDEITVKLVPIKPVNRIMKRFFEILDENKPDRENKLLANLKHLYRTRYGIKNISDYFALLSGHSISFQEDEATFNKCVFLWDDSTFHNQYGILVIDREFSTSTSKERLVFDLRPSTTHDLRSHARESPESKANRVIQFLKQEAAQRGSVIQHLHVAIDVNEKGSGFFNKLEVNPALPSSSGQIKENELAGTLVSLHSVEFNSLFSLSGQQYKFQQQELNEALHSIRPLMASESHAQALFQGIISGLPEEEVVIRFFAESNQSGRGRADGVVKVGKLVKKKVEYETLFVFELKYDSKANTLAAVEELALIGLDQGKEYVRNLKSISDERKAVVIGLAIGGDASLSQTNFLNSKQDIVKVEHITTDEGSQSPQRPPKRKRPLDSSGTGSPSSKRRCRRNASGSCLEYSLEEDEEAKGVIEELLQERERGEVILIADDYALLMLVSLREEEHDSGKLIVISESPEPLEVMHAVLGLVGESQNIDDWLLMVKRDFPKEGTLLENNKHLIHFSELKAVSASEQKPLFKVISDFAHAKGFSSLGIDADSIAAVYLGDHQLLSESWYSSLASDSVNTPSLYRKSLLKPNIIEKHWGSFSYFRELHRVWEQADNHNNNLVLKDTLVSLELAESFFLSVNQALENAGLSYEKSWMPLLDSIGKVENRPASLFFLNLQTHEIRTLDVEIKPFSEFQTHLRSLYEKVNSHFVFDHEEKIPRWSTSIEQAEAVDGLNSAFLLQTLIAWSKQKDRTDLNNLSQTAGNTCLSRWIEIHNYIGLAQMGHGAISDITKVVSLVKTLVSEEQVAVKSTLSAFRSGLNAFFNEGLGILFNTANVVMDIGELSEANTEAERTIFSTQLAFDVGGLSLSLGAGGASLLGATTTASVLGALAVPVVGLNIGITGLVKAFEKVVANAQAVGSYFYQLDNAYRQLGYQKQVTPENNSYMSPLYGAVIKEINFQTNTLHYGDSYLYSSQTKTGSGKSNYILWAGYFPKVIRDKKKAFSIRDRLGYPDVLRKMARRSNLIGTFFRLDSAEFNDIDFTLKTWILPSTPESYLSYSWKNLPFATTRHDTGFSVLRQLEEQEDFHYDFYIFPSEYIVSAITPEFIKTAIKIVLDHQERTLVIPQFSSQERFITQYLHYILESPQTAGKTILHLGKVGSLKLESHHANYNWELVCNNCTNQEGIQFTDTGIKIYGINVAVLNPSLGNYYLHLDSEMTYQLDLVKKQIIPLEIDVAGDRNSTRLMNDYLEKIFQRSPQNLLIKIDNYPMQNNQGENYNGTAFYSTEENRYFYTDGLPIDEMRIILDSSIPFHVNFIGCIEEICYFWATPCYLWSSHRDTHEIIRRYHISAKEIRSAFIVADHSVQIETVLDIYSMDALLSRNSTDYFERHITYYIKPDGELYLASLRDTNDHLLHLFENDNGEVLVSKNITHLVAENWAVGKHFHEENLHSFDQQQALWGGIQEQFTHRLNQFVSILPSSQNARYTPLWIRAQNETKYQLINPGIQEKNLLCLGSLTMKNGTEVLYFYKPSNANELWSVINHEARSQSENTGKLFLKSSEEDPAKALDLSLLSAFRNQEKIFVVTTEQLIEELDAFGKSYLTAVTAGWIKAHVDNWWTEISILSSTRLTETTGPISIYGLQDQSGQALGVWYEGKRQSFIFTQPPLNEQGKQLPIRYLTSQGVFDFSFCAENGILYQAKSYAGSVHESFNGTQLKVKLADLIPFVTSLKTIRLQNKRWILETQKGEIFSSRFLPANHWYIEEIGKDCFNQCEIDIRSFPARTSHIDNNIRRSLLNLDSIFNKNCFDDKEKPVFSSCSIDNFKRIMSHQENATCLSVNTNQAVPIMHFWWLPNPGNYFYDIYHKAIHSWKYLGLCKQMVTQNELGACFFSEEDRMIYFSPEGSRGDIQGDWDLLNKHKTRMQAGFVQKQGDLFLLVIKADRPSDSGYANEHFIPLLTGVKTIGLLLENTMPNFPYKIHKEMLMHYDKVLFYQSHHTKNTNLYFPLLKKGRQFIAQKKGDDIVLKFPYFRSQWIFVNAIEANSFNKTWFSFENAEIKGKVLETEDGFHIIDARSSYYEAIETIRQVFSQRTEENLTLRYKIAVEGSSQTHHYQSARLLLEQPGVKVQQSLADRNKVFWQPNYLWWALGAGTITFFSAMALVASARYGFIRRQDPAREDAIPLVTMVATAAALTPLLPKAQAYELPTFKGAAIHSGFSAELDCRKAETLIGLLGFCSQKEEIIYWHQAEKKSTINFERYSLNHAEKDIYYLNYENKGEWKLDLNKLKLISLDEIQPYLSPNLYKQLAEQKKQQEILTVFRQQIVITSGHYLGNILALHTSMGDLFKAIGLAPNWQARDDIHFLSRCWITAQQLLSQQTFSRKLLSLSVGLSELALLHPRIQSTYTYLTNNSDFSKAKTVIRFIGDLLQLGLYTNVSYLTRLLEFCFPNNESIWKLSLGLRMVSYFYLLTDDLSYWYLGMALFVLPYVPILLENLGVPATRGLHEVCHKLAQVFVGQSLLNKLSEDAERIAQRDRELMLADERVRKGRERLKNFTRSRFSFFVKNENVYPFSANDEIEREQSSQLTNPSLG